MTERTAAVESTGLKGRLGAWYSGSSLRRLSEVWLLGNLRPRFLEMLRRRMRGDDIVLDAGCGSGFYSLPVAERLPRGRLICVDLSDEMLTRLRRRAAEKGLEKRVEIRKGDVTALALDDASADLAISTAVWHELSDPGLAAAELIRVLRPGGPVVVSDFGATGLGKRFGAANRRGQHGPFSAEELPRLLRSVGFVDVAAEVFENWIVAWGAKSK